MLKPGGFCDGLAKDRPAEGGVKRRAGAGGKTISIHFKWRGSPA